MYTTHLWEWNSFNNNMTSAQNVVFNLTTTQQHKDAAKQDLDAIDDDEVFEPPANGLRRLSQGGASASRRTSRSQSFSYRNSSPRGPLQTDDPNLVSAIWCYVWSWRKFASLAVICVLTLGSYLLYVALRHRRAFVVTLIKLTHKECSLDKTTVFLAKLTFRNYEMWSTPILIESFSDTSWSYCSKTYKFETAKPINRIVLAVKQWLLRSNEYLNENESASPFKVHIDQQGDQWRAGLDLGSFGGLFFWNADRQLFQRLDLPPAYFTLNRSNAALMAEEALMTQEVIDDKAEPFLNQILSANETILHIELYRVSLLKTIAYYVMSLLTGLLIPMACFLWRPDWGLLLTSNQTTKPLEATHVRLTDVGNFKTIHVRQLWLASRRGVLLETNGRKLPRTTWRYFNFEGMPFVLDDRSNKFVPGFQLLEELAGHTEASSEPFRHPWARRVLAGFNVMPVPRTPLWLLFWRETFTPMYVFQMACCIMWFSIDYYIYAGCLVGLSLCTISWAVYMSWSNERAIRLAVIGKQNKDKVEADLEQRISIMAGQEDNVTGHVASIHVTKLVPGDIIFLEPRSPGHMPQLPADMVLIRGSCLVDESMLSGEVTPVNKFANSNFIGKPLENNVLHSGTRLLNLAPNTVAMVTAIGFSTTRGKLVRACLRTNKADHRFTLEVAKFSLGLFSLGIIGVLYSVIIRALRREDASTIIILCIVLISVIIPPQISVCVNVAQVIAQFRLRKTRIFCTNPKSITPSGSVDLICFDKTGTLTEESVKLKTVLAIENGSFVEDPPLDLQLCAAGCNVINLLPQTSKTPLTLTGDPIDLELLQFSQFCFADSGLFYSSTQPGLKLEQLKNFGFSPERRSAAVIARITSMGSDELRILVKGAPENLLANCQKNSVPPNFEQILHEHTQKGLRLIVLGSRQLYDFEEDFDKITLEELQTNLQLCGVALFENAMKPETQAVIKKLKMANLRCIMITGDDVRTALATARQSGFLDETSTDYVTIYEMDEVQIARMHKSISTSSFLKEYRENSDKHLAITEQSWQVLKAQSSSAAFQHLLDRCVVFARFRPDQKAEVVASYQKAGLTVAMIGDGANDCCALKAADVGVALSDAEASVASSFSCRDRNIKPLLEILSEGRCSLVSTFGLFSIMVSYSVVQFCSMCITYWIQASFTNFEFIYIDLFLLTTLSFCYTWVPSNSAARLNPERPARSLFDLEHLIPLFLHNVTNVGFQILAFVYVQKQPWFLPYFDKNQMANIKIGFRSFEVYALFAVSVFQYVWAAFIFSTGPPHRAYLFRSKLFTSHLAVVLIANHFIVVYLPKSIEIFLGLTPVPSFEFRIVLLLLSYVNLGACFVLVYGSRLFIKKLRRIKWTLCHI